MFGILVRNKIIHALYMFVEKMVSTSSGCFLLERISWTGKEIVTGLDKCKAEFSYYILQHLKTSIILR